MLLYGVDARVGALAAPRRRPRAVVLRRRGRRGRGRRAGGNCIKMSLPGKSILGDYFQENGTSKRPFLSLRISFPGRPFYIQFVPAVRRRGRRRRLLRGRPRRRIGRRVAGGDDVWNEADEIDKVLRKRQKRHKVGVLMVFGDSL